MTKVQTASEQIIEEVTSWPGVTAGPGVRGELAFKVGRREIGHLHGDRAAHFSFPKNVWAELYEQGRIDYHPVFPGKPGFAARRIESAADVRDVIALLRLNYDRGRAGNGGLAEEPPQLEVVLPGLYASAPEPLPFAPTLHIRAFLLRRERGNLLLYSVTGFDEDAVAVSDAGGIARQYLSHRHEAWFASEKVSAPLFVHENERASVEERARVEGTFSSRHRLDDDFEAIPIPGHTSGATAYLWESGDHRYLFTGDTIYLSKGEWVAAVLESSDRDRYVESLELTRELEFDVLVPWAATVGTPYYAMTSKGDAQARIDAILARVREGEDR
jgi:hypothetical protein